MGHRMPHDRPRRILLRLAPLAGVCALFTLTPGCFVPTFIGMMAESAYLAGDTEFQAAYDGLTEKTYAVVVSADRVIQAENPGIIDQVTRRVNELLAEHAGASGHIPTDALLNVLYNNPQWQAMPRGELGDRLGVQRLVVVEMREYRLTEPGNRYVWDGLASALVEVYEIDSGIPDDPLFERTVEVKFPDYQGVLRERYEESLVTSTLAQRLTDRIAWMFYTHKEPNTIEY